MTAVEKVAWTEFGVSVGSTAIVIALYPWFGDRAAGAFGLLGLMALSAWFLRRQGSRVVVDERDAAISRKATQTGVQVAWMGLFVALALLGTWANLHNAGIVPSRLLNWLIWIQFAVCYAVKGFVGVLAYRRQGHAA